MQPTVLAPVLSSIPPQSITPFKGKAQIDPHMIIPVLVLQTYTFLRDYPVITS